MGLCRATSYKQSSFKGSTKTKTNLITVWLDYANAFDSVSHSWLFTALHLAKVPENIVVSIEKMSKFWATIVTLRYKSNDQN